MIYTPPSVSDIFWRRSRNFLAALSATTLIACDANKSLNPPKSGDSVQISIKLPTGFISKNVKANYRSKDCLYSGYSRSNGLKFTEEGFQSLTLSPQKSTDKEIYMAIVPVDGGGSCNWKLSNLTFGISYESVVQFGADVAPGRYAEVIVRYDENRSPASGGREKTVEGDLSIKADYYPWIHERFIGGHKTSIHLFGQLGDDLSFYAPGSRKIYFEPSIHSDFIVYSKGNKKKVIGLDPIFTYPDGSTQPERLDVPNFEKLQSIRLNAEQPNHH